MPQIRSQDPQENTSNTASTVNPASPASTTSTTNTTNTSTGSSSYKAGVIAASVFGAVCAIGIVFLLFLRWRKRRAIRYSLSGRDDNEHHDVEITAATARTAATQTTPAHNSVASVDRTTSIRSVMTLPPYRPKPDESEHVLGREGERGGIDVVIELPTAEHEEAMRDEEMEALFQIRQARRRQMAEREQRRQARREAQSRNDRSALHTIRQQSQQATATNAGEIENLRGELVRARETRQRAISSVSYADVGIARHDGTRIRANSNESERIGLLSDVASIEASNRSSFQHHIHMLQSHSRGQSASSLLSIDTTHSDGQPTTFHAPQSSRSRASSTGQPTPAGSSPEMVDAADSDLGGAYMPPHSPPGYDEVSLDGLTPAHSRPGSPYPEPPPDYTASTEAGPQEERNRRLSAHVADLAAEASGGAAAAETVETGGHPARASSGLVSRSDGIPRLPSLHLAGLPQIVIEPSSAVSRDADDHR